MEKCTYCTQRIQETKIKTKVNAQRKATLETGMDGKDLVLELDDVKVLMDRSKPLVSRSVQRMDCFR